MPTHEVHVASLDDIDDPGMHQVDVEGAKIFLVRVGDDINAVGATCPHAGAPLVEGIQHGDRLICPWHKATFCARTGEVLEPPALDALPRYDVRVDGQRILVTLPAAAPSSTRPRAG
jgi:nitrite reductase/ring-hydroxylating ferredoxin subunit